MDQVIIFNKTCEQRLEEYKNVLSQDSQDRILPASQVKKQWLSFLEMEVEYAGWQAVWKISRLECEKLKIPYPTIVLVYIDQVNHEDLSASVKILAVQDEIPLSENHIVPLIQLWPTQQQDETVYLNLSATANALDMFRVFYNHLWMPWDIEDDDLIDWVDKNLEVRLRLYYDLKLGVIPRKTAEHLRSLFNEAKNIQTKREHIEEQLVDDDDDDDDDQQVPIDENIQTIMTMHMRMMQIKNEFEILENPVLRNILIQKLNKSKSECEKRSEINYWLIFQCDLNLDDYMNYVQQVKNIIPANKQFKTSTSLIKTVELASPNDMVIIGPGKHAMFNTGSLEEGGIMKGVVNDNSKTIIESSKEGIMLDFTCTKVVLENLTLDASRSQYGMVIRKGHVTLTNCKLVGNGHSSIHQGIVVLNDSTLILENCEITGFNSGLIANSGSKVIITNSQIHHVNFGLKFCANTSIHLEKTIIQNCEECAISAETEDENFVEKQKIGDLSILLNYFNITGDGCKFMDNKLGDVFLNKKMKIIPVRDLFSNPTYDNILNYTTNVF